jgi:DNA polymerase (family 10)
LHHFTGGQAHNIALRERAVKMGINISEYGLARAGTGDYKPVATEEDLYSRLGLAYIPPELREDTGEIEAADRGNLPDLVSVEDVRGDLHVHTNYSDGKGTIESMAEAAIELGYEYLVFCDHSRSLRVANGLSPERLKKKMEAVRKADDGYGEIHLLCGSEVDILRDGSLDYDDDILAGLDFVVASVHTSFGVGEKAMTERIVRAMNPMRWTCRALYERPQPRTRPSSSTPTWTASTWRFPTSARPWEQASASPSTQMPTMSGLSAS